MTINRPEREASMAKATTGTRGGAAGTVQALRLLGLEMAAMANARQRRRIAAAAPLLAMLFERFLVLDVQGAPWPDRDRLVVSPALRPLARAMTRLLGQGEADAEGGGGVHEMDLAEADAVAGGVRAKEPGVHGPSMFEGLDLPLDQPGHSLAAGVGLALATRLLRERYGAEIFDHATCLVVDDCEVEPGIAQETIAIAPFLRPHRLFVLHLTPEDAQGRQVRRHHCPNHLARFAAAGWHVQQARADDPDSIVAALEQGADQGVASWEERRPVYIAVHYRADVSAPAAEELREELGWGALGPGEVPDAVRDAWRLAGLRGRKARKEWRARLEQLDTADRSTLDRQLERPFPERFRAHMRDLRQKIAEEGGVVDMGLFLFRLLAESHGVLSGLTVLSALPDDELAAADPAPAGEAGDDGTDGDVPPVLPTIPLGLRPAAMAALLTGLSAHGGLRPVGLARRHQLEPMLPMLDEAARARLPLGVLVVDDAPCQTPLHDTLPAGVGGFTPADAVELVECWQVCIQQEPSPGVVLAPEGRRVIVRDRPERLNLCAFGAYELFSGADAARAIVYATGGHLAAAAKAARALEEEGLAVRVVSMPAPHRLRLQDAAHRRRIIGGEERRIIVSQAGERGTWPFPAAIVSFVSPCAEGERLSEDDLAGHIARAVRKVLAGGGDMAGGDEAASQAGNGGADGEEGA